MAVVHCWLIVNDRHRVSLLSRSPFMVPPLLLNRLTNSWSGLPWQMTALSIHCRMSEMARTDDLVGGQSTRSLEVVGAFTPCAYTLHIRSSVTGMLHVIFGACHWSLLSLQYSKWSQKKPPNYQVDERWSGIASYFKCRVGVKLLIAFRMQLQKVKRLSQNMLTVMLITLSTIKLWTCSLFTPPVMPSTTCCVGIHWPEKVTVYVSLKLYR